MMKMIGQLVNNTMKSKELYESPMCEHIVLSTGGMLLNGSIDNFEEDPTDPWSAPLQAMDLSLSGSNYIL